MQKQAQNYRWRVTHKAYGTVEVEGVDRLRAIIAAAMTWKQRWDANCQSVRDRKAGGQRDEEAGMQQLRMGLPRRAAGRHDGASLRVPSRRSGANTSEVGRNPDAAAKYLLWKNYPAISDANGRLRRRKAASLVPEDTSFRKNISRNRAQLRPVCRGQPPALTMAGWPYTLYIRAYAAN